MKRISQFTIHAYKTVRAFALTAVAISLLAAAGSARVTESSFLNSVSEFLGWQIGWQNTAAPRTIDIMGDDPLRLNSAPAGMSMLPPVPTIGAAVTENFNGLGNSATASLPADWRVGQSVNYADGVSVTTNAAGTSGTGVLTTTSGGGYYNFASGVTATSTDRAVGFISATGFTSPRQLFVRLTNNTGVTIGSFDVAYAIEKYRNGQRNYTVNFFTSTDGTTWTAQTAGNQSYTANGNNNVVNPPTTTNKSFEVTGVSVPPGGDLYLRWSYTGTGGSTNAMGLGIDDFSFTPREAVPGSIEFSAATYSDPEGINKVVTVNRVGGNSGAASVDYSIGGGTATAGASCGAGVDYVTTSGTLNWANGEQGNRTFNVQLCNDLNTVEDPETFNLTLTNAQGAAMGTQSSAVFTINDAPAVFVNNTPMTIPEGGPASVYPSTIEVAGLAGVVSTVGVTLTGVSHTYPDDVVVLLVGPEGQKFVLLAYAGGNPDITNRTYTFADSAANLMNDQSATPSGTYRPSAFGGVSDLPEPAPANPYSHPEPAGIETLNATFFETEPNGTWSLYVYDVTGPDAGSINGGWSLHLETEAAGPGTLGFASATDQIGESATAMVNVNRIGGSFGAVSVDYATDGGDAISGAACTAGVDYISASGTLNWVDGDATPKQIYVQTCADNLLSESLESLQLTLSNPTGTTITGTNPATLNIVNSDFPFSNHGTITIPDSGAALTYPSTIVVSGLTGTFNSARLRLNDFSHTFSRDVSILLVGPQGQNFILYSNAGPNGAISNTNVLLSDAAADVVPETVFPSGTYKPTNRYNPPDYPLPAPAGPFASPGPLGTDTFASVFGGTDPNGTWSLYVFDMAGGDMGWIAGGWDLDITTNPPGAGSAQFAFAEYGSSETNADHTVDIAVKRMNGSLGAVTVDYAVTDGAATVADNDYAITPATGTLSWADGETADQIIQVTVKGDTKFETDETVNFALSNPTGGLTLGTVNTSALYIYNDDPQPLIFVVNTNDDTYNGGCTTEHCSLREAITIANSLPGTITFAPNVIGAIDLDSTLPSINMNGSVVINGPGPDVLTIRRAPSAGNFNMLYVINTVGGTATINNLTFSGHFGSGGAINIPFDASLAVNNCVFIENSSSVGGAIHINSDGLLSVNNSIFSSNSTSQSGGAIDNAGTVTITNSIFDSNRANVDGGAIRNTGGGTLSMTGSSIVNNVANGGGGAIFNHHSAGAVTITDGNIMGNTAGGLGGGIDLAGSAALNVTRTNIGGNTAGNHGGGIFNSTSAVTITDSAIYGNAANGGTSAQGGGLQLNSTGSYTVTNTTISGNQTTGSGGGFYAWNGNGNGSASFTSCTIAGNYARFAGGLRADTGMTVNIRNSILADNTVDIGNRDLMGTFVSGGYNMVEFTDGMTMPAATGDQFGVNPMLGFLWQNGGSTWSHALLPGSPAIDAGNAFGETTDQRGFVRPVDNPSATNVSDGSDIGAFESNNTSIIVTGGSLNFGSVMVGSTSPEQTYTVSGTGLTGDITLNAPPDFQMSTTSGSGFASTLTLPHVGGVVATTTIYVRFSPTSTVLQGNMITHTSPLAVPQVLWLHAVGASPGTLTFSSATYSVNEGYADHTFNVPVQRVSGSTGAVTVNYFVTDGTATVSNNDYSITPYTGTLSWADGDYADKNIQITIKGDVTVEPDETINLLLIDQTGGAVLGIDDAVLTIVNDDTPPTTYTVTTTDDANDGACNAAHCSLREAIIAINSNHGDIVFAPSVTGEIALLSALPIINSSSATIHGPGADILTVRPAASAPNNRIFALESAGGKFAVWGLSFKSGIGNGGTGGAIYNFGTGSLSVYNCFFQNNTAANNGGAIAHGSPGFLRVSGSVFRNNTAPGGPGGAISVVFNPQVTIDNSTFRDNSANSGGTIYLESGSMTFMYNIIDGSSSSNQGGGIYNQGNGSIEIRGSLITRATTSSTGGAVINGNTGTLTIRESTIRGNTAGTSGGGVESYGGTVNITNSTLTGNRGGNGGALHNNGAGTYNITNSTISGNTAINGGGGLDVWDGNGVSTVNITASTFTGNTANLGGGIHVSPGMNVTIRNTIVAGNTTTGIAPDMYGPLTSGGYNLIGNNHFATFTPTTGDQVGTPSATINALLGPLQINGGGGFTHELLAGSPAIDAGNAFGLTTDGREFARPVDNPSVTNVSDGSDIGAFESNNSAIVVTGGPLDFGGVRVGTNSAEQSYTVSGTNLLGDLTINAPYEFEVSITSGSGFGPSVTLTPMAGTVPTTTIYVRFAPQSTGVRNLQVANQSTAAVPRSVDVTGTGTQPGSVQFSAATYSIGETNADHVVVIPVTRTGGAMGATSVDYTISNGTAASGADYTVTSATGTLNWANGETATKNIEITIVGDNVFEGDETINLALSNATNGAIIGQAAAVLTITNDDVQPAISIDDTHFTGDTLVPNMFTVTLSNPSSQTVTVEYETADDTAIAGEDYTTTSGTLTFNPGETSQTIPVAVLPNTTNEATEQFFVNLDTPVNATIADDQGIGTIFDDDPQPTLSINDWTSTEGNSGQSAMTFTVTKGGGATTQTVTVQYATVNAVASSPTDFDATSGTLTFLPNETTKTITININGDTDYETTEVFHVRLSNPVAADIIDGEGMGVIQNDDTAVVREVNVNADTDDGACTVENCSLREAINDANATGGDIWFATGFTGSINLLTPLPQLTNPNAIHIYGPGANIVTVKRDAEAPAMRIFDINGTGVYSISGLAINDGDVRPIGGAFNNLGGGIRILNSRGVTISQCTFTNNWANNGAAIYNGVNPANGPLNVEDSTFTANNAGSGGGGIENRFGNRLNVNRSTFNANGANNFGGGIHNRDNGRVEIWDSVFTGNVANTGAGVNNDDTGSLTINRSTISGNNAVVGGGISNRNGGLDVFDSTLSGNTASEGGAAYNHVATMNFYNSTISGNTASSLGGGIYFTLQGASHGMISNTTITGNQAPNGGGVMIFSGQSVVRIRSSILAGNTGNQGPDLYGTIHSGGYNILGTTGGSWGNMNPATGDQIGQFSIINAQLAPLADNGGPTRTHALLPGSPALNNGNAFDATADQRGYARVVGGTADVGALEMQSAPVSIATYSGTPQSMALGGPFAPLQALVTDTNGDPVAGVAVTFTAPASGPSASFPGNTNTFTVFTDIYGIATTPVSTAITANGSYDVTASYPSGPVVNFALTNVPRPGISVNDVTFTGVDSRGVVTGFEVTLSEPSSQTITVHYQTVDGTAIAGEDYDARSGTLVFNPGATMVPVPMVIIADNIQEASEHFYISLDSPSANSFIADAQGIGTIPNDDAAPTFAIGDVTQAEGNAGTTDFVFTITRTGDTTLPSTVNYEANAVTAAESSDFTGVTSAVEFLANETTKQVAVSVTGDIRFELNETFTVDLTSSTNGTFTDNSGLGTITNDDAAPVLTINDVTLDEGNSGTTNFTFTITKTGTTDLSATVEYTTAIVTALPGEDFNSTNGTLSFAPGETTKSVTVQVIGDAKYEHNEQFAVNLSNATGASISDGQGIGTIVNDDELSSFAINDLTQAEGNAGTTAVTFTITKTGETAINTSVNYETVDGTATAAGLDYEPVSPTQVVFLAAETSKTITILVNGDTVFEGGETFTVHLSGNAGGNISDADGTGTIVNDDAAPTLAINDVTFSGVDARQKGKGTEGAVTGFTVTLTGTAQAPVTVGFNTVDGTAVAGEDYTATSGTLTFNSGETTKFIPITILPDNVQENTEQFAVRLTSPTVATIADDEGVGTIMNDDAGPVFSVDNVTLSEGNSGTTNFNFTITKVGSTAIPSTVLFQTVDASANAPGDYIHLVGNVTFASSETTKQVTVQVNGDVALENDETFTLRLISTDNGSIGTADGTGTIVNDDTAASVQFAAATYMEDESQTAAVNVTRSGDTTGTTTVNYSLSNGTAIGGAACSAGIDYVNTGGTVTFNPGETSRPVNVVICTDSLPEPVQTFNVTLSNPSSPAVIGTQNSTTVSINDTASQFRSADPLTIGSEAPANPYPTTINVKGLPATSGSVRVTIYDVSHANPEDLDLLLVSPTGQKVVLMADAGGSNALSNTTITFDDLSGRVLPDSGAITTGKYEPTTWATVSSFAPPAPSGPYIHPGSVLGGMDLRNTFGSDNPNGVWSLFVRDQSVNPRGNAPEGSGQIAGGWGLEFIAPTAAEAEISGRVLTADGRPIANAQVAISGGGLPQTLYVTTGHLGYYSFNHLPIGQAYVVTVLSKRFTFADPTRLLMLNDNMEGEDFVAQPQE